MRARDWRVVVVIPDDGPLVPLLTERGAEVEFLAFPVVRRSNMSAAGIVALGADAMRALPGMRRLLRSVAPDAVYVNTVTIPWWITAARSVRIGAVCHVHEAEAEDRRLIRVALNTPLLAANSLIAISPSVMDATTRDVPALKRRTHLIYNGVPQPSVDVPAVPAPLPFRLAVIGRLSPRKAPHIALEAVAELRRAGRDVHLDVCGTPFAGYEWYEQELRARAQEDDLAGAVTFSGYVSPVWPALARSHAVLAPSLREPFGNAVVEAQFACRPVIAAAAMGHLETVQHEETGLLVPPGEAGPMAASMARLMDDPGFAMALAERARARAVDRFAVDRYGSEIADLVGALRPDRRRARNHGRSARPREVARGA
ncbi:glycosyltransferase family 4 protein [Allobranchiibius sp. CTAmp26]|nr:glycosyltransferase family 4 protein [Allobranchiibius sp. CTAmp26]